MHIGKHGFCTVFLMSGNSREHIESKAYTIKEINAVTGCQLFTATALCNPRFQSVVQEVWSKPFVNTDTLFCANKKVHCGQVEKSLLCSNAYCKKHTYQDIQDGNIFKEILYS